MLCLLYTSWTVQEDGTVQELLPEVFKIQEGRGYGVIPDFIGIGPGGEILVSESSEANVYLPDGKKSVTLAQDFTGLDVRIPACLTGDEYVTMSNQQLVRYNITTGRITERYNMPENGSGSNMMIGPVSYTHLDVYKRQEAVLADDDAVLCFFFIHFA